MHDLDIIKLSFATLVMFSASLLTLSADINPAYENVNASNKNGKSIQYEDSKLQAEKYTSIGDVLIMQDNHKKNYIEFDNANGKTQKVQITKKDARAYKNNIKKEVTMKYDKTNFYINNHKYKIK